MNLTLPIAAGLLAVYIFWGGTYLAMKFAIETMPPFLMAGIRFLTAGALVYAWQMSKGTPRPSVEHWKNAAIVGGLLLLCGNGGVVWAEQTVSSGIAAIIVATVPLWMALIAWLWQGGKRPNGLILGGLLIGFIGIILLVKSTGGDVSGTAAPWTGYAALVGASLAWAVGSMYSRVAKLPETPLLAIALQMLTGGFFCLTFGLLTGEAGQFQVAAISLQSALALGYLIFFGSIIGFSAFIWLLKAADPTLASTYAYVNPIVAVILGWLLAGEQMTLQAAAAAAIIVTSVVMITKGNQHNNKADIGENAAAQGKKIAE